MIDNFSVPWICKTELLCVFQNLYSESVRERQNAIQHIAVWKARCNPWQSRLPVSIICSADLIGAELDHHLYTRQESSLTEEKVSQSLALALIRFVNFITERYQHDSSNVAIPIHRICAQIGIPAWIVGLRHEATHRALPALSVLARGTQWAISWLKENFWEQQMYDPPPSNSSTMLTDGESVSAIKADDDDGPTGSGTTDGNRKISCLFVAYQQIRCQELSGKDFSLADISTGVECRHVVNEIKKLFSLVKNRVVPVLVQIGYLLPTDDQLAQLGVIPGLHSDERIRCVLAVFWWPLLQELNNIRVISQLVQSLMLLLTDHQCPGRRYVLIWLQILLSRDAVKFFGGGKAQLFSNSISFLKLPWLRQCLQNPNQYSVDVLQLLSDGELTEEATSKLSSLLNIYSEQEASELCIGPDSYTAQAELPISSDDHSPISCDGGNNSGSSWQHCTEKIDWIHLPVGICPYQQNPQRLFHSLNDYCESVYSQEDIPVIENLENSSSCEPSAYCWNMNQRHLIQSHLRIYQ